MSQPRLHDVLNLLYQERDSSLLDACLKHPDFEEFTTKFEILVPTEKIVWAFTHTSFSHEYQQTHQEQLEFLGDAVLQLILTDEIYRKYPGEKEGRLSKLRSAIVNEKTLATIASSLGLDQLILVGKGEYKKGLHEQDTVLADTMEALLGQVYLHQGLDFTKKLFINWLKTCLPESLEWEFLENFDAKSKLQEMSLAKYKKLPKYTAEANGDQFDVKLFLDDEEVLNGTFSSKKSGEKTLAQNAIDKNLI
jgi:ribonuclease-3